MKRREAHLRIAEAYGCAAGDAIALAIERVKADPGVLQKVWPVDGVHPCDEGYQLFADAAWQAFEAGFRQSRRRVCAVPDKTRYGETYLRSARVRISSLAPLPAGGQVGRPNLVSAYFDMLMSRWLDDETILSIPKAPAATPPARLSVKFHGSMVLLFGESTLTSCLFHAYVDGKLLEHEENKKMLTEFDAGKLAKLCHGNVHLTQRIVQGLDASVEHTLEIEPLQGSSDQELRLESICVAGGTANVERN